MWGAIALSAMLSTVFFVGCTSSKPEEPQKSKYPVAEREGYTQKFDTLKSTVRRIENEKGYSIFGRVFTPIEYEFNSKMPILIMSHGNGAVGADQTNSVVQNAVKNGMIVYTFDFCAATRTGKSEGPIGTATTEDESSDLCCVIDYFLSADYVDTTRMALWGHSRGGAVTSLTIGKYKDIISAVVLEAPAIGMGADDVATSETAIKMNEYEKPFYVFWGSDDEQIPVENAYKLQDYFGEKMSLMVVDGAMHSLQPANYKETLPVMNEYLRSAGVMPAEK